MEESMRQNHFFSAEGESQMVKIPSEVTSPTCAQARAAN